MLLLSVDLNSSAIIVVFIITPTLTMHFHCSLHDISQSNQNGAHLTPYPMIHRVKTNQRIITRSHQSPLALLEQIYLILLLRLLRLLRAIQMAHIPQSQPPSDRPRPIHRVLMPTQTLPRWHRVGASGALVSGLPMEPRKVTSDEVIPIHRHYRTLPKLPPMLRRLS